MSDESAIDDGAGDVTADDGSVLALALDLDRLMRLLHCSTRHRAEVVDRARIGPFGAMALLTIADREPVPVQALAGHLARDKAQITRTVKLLEETGLIRRSRSSTDGRVWLISLTEDGREHVAGFRQLLADVVTGLTGGLDEGERRQFSAVLAKMLASAELAAGTPPSRPD
ncbi:MAG: MarR family transcriptional regulator [Actinomycetota bacterium]